MFLIPSPKKLILLLVIAYALLPPIVAKQVGLENAVNNPVYDFVFYPLLRLADKFPAYRVLLDTEARLIGIDDPEWRNPISNLKEVIGDRVRESDRSQR